MKNLSNKYNKSAEIVIQSDGTYSRPDPIYAINVMDIEFTLDISEYVRPNVNTDQLIGSINNEIKSFLKKEGLTFVGSHTTINKQDKFFKSTQHVLFDDKAKALIVTDTDVNKTFQIPIL